jgi:starch phosphorylase
MELRGTGLRANLPPDLESLAELAMDLRWTWSHAGDELWKSIDRETWERTENPFVVLQSLGEERLRELDCNTAFKAQLRSLVAARADYAARATWAQQTIPAGSLRGVAYFSMEFGLAEALPLYAGGLGVLAGDHLKAASDLGLPLVGIGLLYQEGYFRQSIDDEGRQLVNYPFNDPASLPVAPVFDRGGAWLSIPVEYPGRTVRFRIWKAEVGRVPLYLLDSNDPWNDAIDRGITGKLYEAATEMRLIQEIALGVCGWRLIEVLGLEIDVCHLNEGHAAFAAIERARCFMERHALGFREAVWAVRAGNVFTTHTPVAASFDIFPIELLKKYAGDHALGLGVPVAELAALGQGADDHGTGFFNMAWLAARLCATVNGVSRLHGEVSRGIFAELYPGWPLAQIPVVHVTNGVHMPSWDSAAADKLWTSSCGKDRWLGVVSNLCAAIDRTDDKVLWEMKGAERRELVAYARRRLGRQLARRQRPGAENINVVHILDPNALTLGFARRFTEYKRPALLLRDVQRLKRLLSDSQRPVQLIVAGKAHPADTEGQRFIQEWARFSADPEVRQRVVFLEDYNLPLAQELVKGVDIWINTPRRPWEACGTSGMKVLVNGGLNLSVLDGWWAEAYDPAVGWAIQEVEGPVESRDAAQRDQLFEILEREVVPMFYTRDASGLPLAWLARMRASMARLTPEFSTNRMVRDYVHDVYLPAADLVTRRTQDGGRGAVQLATWERDLHSRWAQVNLGPRIVEKGNGLRKISVSVYLGDIHPDMVDVQLYADAMSPGGAEFCQSMERSSPIPGSSNGYSFELMVKPGRDLEDFTPRIVPRHALARVPNELALIKWAPR